MHTRVARCLTVAVVVMASCGGGQAAIGKQEYLQRAAEICAAGTRELEAASQEAFAGVGEDESLSAERIADYARTIVVPMVRRQVQQLRSLPDPEGGAKQVAEIYDAVDAALDRIEENPELLSGGAEPFAEAEELSKRYGFELCGG